MRRTWFVVIAVSLGIAAGCAHVEVRPPVSQCSPIAESTMGPPRPNSEAACSSILLVAVSWDIPD
jgi:hypothetical protein